MSDFFALDNLDDRDRFLTRREAARYLGKTVQTLARWHQLGTGPRSVPCGRSRLYPLVGLREFRATITGTGDALPPEWRCVYVISNGEAVKVGIATDPAERLRYLQSAAPQKLEIVYRTSPLEDAGKVERRAHRLLVRKRLRGEWFGVTAQEAKDAIRLATAESALT